MTLQRRILLACAFLLTVLIVPAVPAAVETLTHLKLSQVDYVHPASQGPVPDYDHVEPGFMTITRCSRDALVLSWRCDGRFSGLDSDGMRSVRLADDYRRHRSGEDVAVNVAKNGSEAYAWGGTYVIRMVLILAGLILSLAAAAAVFIRSVPVGLAMVLLLSGLLLRLSGAGMTFI